MITPLIPSNERLRLKALLDSDLLDSGPDAQIDRLTKIAQQSFAVDFAWVSLVDSQKQWFKSVQGLDICETGRDISFCGHAILNKEVLVVENALEDRRFFDNPLVQGELHIRFYAGAPLCTTSGYCIGTLCIIDRQPRSFSKSDIALLRELADCVEEHINQYQLTTLRHSLAASESRAQLIIEGAGVGTWQWDLRTGDCECNERWAEMQGYSLQELTPFTLKTWEQLVHPEDIAPAKILLDRHLAGEDPDYESIYRVRHRTGRWVWVHSRGRLLNCTVKGEPLTMYGTHIDITAERAARAQLERKNQALALLNRIAFELTGTLDEQIQQALALSCHYLRLDLGIISEIVGDIYAVRWVEAPLSADIVPGTRFTVANTYCHLLLQQTGILAVSHMAKSLFNKEDCYQQLGLESYLAIRLEVEGRLFGTLNFSAMQPKLDPFDDTDLMFLGLLAHWLGELLSTKIHEERLNKLLEQTPGMLYQYRCWPDGRSCFPYSSRGIEKIYRVSAQSVQEDASAVFDLIYPPDLAQVNKSILASEQQLDTWYSQYRIRQADGSLRWAEGRAQPEKLEDGSTIWHGYLVDINHEKQVNLALTMSEQRLRCLFELSSIGIALNDFYSGEFIDVNQALLDATGFSKAQILALDYRTLTPEQYQQQDLQALAEVKLHGRYAPYEKEYLRWDGSRFPVRQQGILIKDESGRSLLWSLVEDISELKKAERMQKEFVAMVSHELRTPLTSIGGSLGLLDQGVLGKLPEKVEQLVRVAYQNSQRLNLLITDLLDIEKLTVGEMRFNVQAHHLNDLVLEAIAMNRPLGKTRGVQLELIAGAENAWVLTDRDRFLQALSNLQSNAIKYSPELGCVTVAIERCGEQWRVLVKDQGEGVPISFQSRIFEKFAQADSSDTRQKGGTGLGLAITKELMWRMQGDVGFESTPGQGACFWLEIPEHTAPSGFCGAEWF